MKKIILGLFLLLVTGFAAAQKEVVVEEVYDGRTVKLVIPAGFCHIPKSTGAEAYEIMTRLQKGANTVAAIFVDCRELEKLANDPDYTVKRHGLYLFSRSTGREQALPATMDRSAFIAKMLELETGGRGVESKKGEVEKEISKRLLNEKDLGLAVGGFNIGIIDYTPATIYYGMGLTASHAGKDKRVTGVMTLTAVNQVAVNANLYDDYDPKVGFTRLLAASKRLYARLEQANR